MTDALREPFDYAAHALAARQACRYLLKVARDRSASDEPAQSHESAADAAHAAVSAAYPPGFWEAYWQLKAKDPRGLEHAVRFLEADPWFFRSGYIKCYLLRFLWRMEISLVYQGRLREAILQVVQRRDGPEFLNYCRLARRLDTPEFRRRLDELTRHKDPAVRRRAVWVLHVMQHHGRRQPPPQPTYPPGLQEATGRLLAGDEAGLDPVVAYLEARSWLPHHVHVRRELISFVSCYRLSGDHVERLQRTLLDVLAHPRGERWHDYSPLLSQLDSEAFRAMLSTRSGWPSFFHWWSVQSVLRELRQQDRPFTPRVPRPGGQVDFYPLPDPWELPTMVERNALLPRLRAGDRTALAWILEMSLILSTGRFPRTKAVKRQLVRVIARTDLEPGDRERLQGFVLRRIDVLYQGIFRREIRWWTYVPLMRRLDTPDFRAQVQERLGHDNPEIRSRAQQVIDTCDLAARVARRDTAPGTP